MEPTKELADALYRERVLRARRTPPEEKVRAALQLSDAGMALMLDGIRHQFPGISDTDARAKLAERLALRRRMEAAP